MKKIVASVVASAVMSMGFVAIQAVEAQPAAAAQVKVPKAKPGQFCKKSHRGDWTKTKKYGKLKCVKYKNGSWRWKKK